MCCPVVVKINPKIVYKSEISTKKKKKEKSKKERIESKREETKIKE